MSEKEQESFDDFKSSFAYGTRTDLNFKFLKELPDQEAATFLQQLLWKLGNSIIDGNCDRLPEHLRIGQQKTYGAAGAWVYSDVPSARLRRPLNESELGLLTSSGHFVEGRDPEPFGVKAMTQEEAVRRIGQFASSKPQLSTIPSNTKPEELRCRHGGYDIRAAQEDPNVVFPLEHLRKLAQEGVIGRLCPNSFSFVGAGAQTPLLNKTGPAWVEKIKSMGLDAVLLVPP